MSTLRKDTGYSSSLAPPPSFRLVTVLALCMLSLVCVVLAVVMILFSNVNVEVVFIGSPCSYIFTTRLALVCTAVLAAACASTMPNYCTESRPISLDYDGHDCWTYGQIIQTQWYVS
jgi:hypothetical protein